METEVASSRVVVYNYVGNSWKQAAGDSVSRVSIWSNLSAPAQGSRIVAQLESNNKVRGFFFFFF
jgi:hypothetical protein